MRFWTACCLQPASSLPPACLQPASSLAPACLQPASSLPPALLLGRLGACTPEASISSFEDLKPPGASRSLQKPPAASRSPQEPPGASRSLQKSQEPPGAPRSLQKPPGASRSLQEPQEPRLQEPPACLQLCFWVPGSVQELPEASRAPEASRSLQTCLPNTSVAPNEFTSSQASRSLQEPPEASSSLQKPPGAS